jgi:large subunit ribosomal protein L5
MTYIPRLKTKYKEDIRTALKEKFAYKSVMQVPKLQKIAINQGVGGATTDKKLIENTITELNNHHWPASSFFKIKKGYLKL